MRVDSCCSLIRTGCLGCGQRHSQVATSLIETEQKNVDSGTFSEGGVGCCSCFAHDLRSLVNRFSLVSVVFALGISSFGLVNLLLSFAGHYLLSTEFISILSFLNGQVAHGPLNTLDIINMKIYFLLEDVQLFFHFNLQIVTTCLNFSKKLLTFFFLKLENKCERVIELT
jgi:hypothetical protein